MQDMAMPVESVARPLREDFVARKLSFGQEDDPCNNPKIPYDMFNPEYDWLEGQHRREAFCFQHDDFLALEKKQKPLLDDDADSWHICFKGAVGSGSTPPGSDQLS